METAFKIFLALAIAGIAAICYGVSELVLTYSCSETPESIPLSALLERGMKGNRYVSVTDHETGKTALEISKKDQSSFGGQVYVPLFAKDGDPKDALLLKMSAFQATFFFDKRKPIEGIVESNWLSDEAKTKLADSYPGLDVDSALVLSVGDKPSSLDFGWRFVAIGVTPILLLCGFVFWKGKMDSVNRRRQAAAGPRASEDVPPQPPTEEKL